MTESDSLREMRVAITLMSIFLDHAATGSLDGGAGVVIGEELNRTRAGYLELITAHQVLIQSLLFEVAVLTGETSGQVLQRIGAGAAAAAEFEADE